MIGEQTFRTVSDNAMKMTGELMGFGRNMWLAGLGTVATVETEVKDTFGTLIERGKKFDEEHKLPVGKVVDEAKGSVAGVGTKVENAVQNAVGSTLHRIGVPTRDEIHSLIDRVEALTAKVETLSKK
jgi:poly(hydroxyalkanoate) granule-associated protein